MLGAVPFANHSFDPNCQYIIVEQKNYKYVKLELLKDIAPDSELNVFYAPNFFDPGNSLCQCPHVQFHHSVPCSSRFESRDISHQFRIKTERIFSRFEDKRFKFVKPNLASGRKKKEIKTFA